MHSAQVVHHTASQTSDWVNALAAAGAVVCVLLFVGLLVWLTRPGGSDDSDDGGGRGPGEPPDGPLPGPDWWPDFERQFAGYVAERQPGLTRGGPAH